MIAEVAKYQQLYEAVFKKYQELYPTKATNLKPLDFFNAETNDWENLIEAYKQQIELVSEQMRLLIKAPNKIDQVIDFKELKINHYDVLVALDVNKIYFKDLAIKTREAHPDKLIIVATPFENAKSALIISSKQLDVLAVLKEAIWQQFELKGGGNQLIWQGVANKKITLAKLKV